MKYDVILNWWPKAQTEVEIITHGRGTNTKFFLSVAYSKVRRRLAKRGKYHKGIGFIIEMDDEEVEKFREEWGDKMVGDRVCERI